MKPRVLIWRTELLHPSETFIAAQTAALRRYQPVYCGLKRVAPSLTLEHPAVLPRHWARAQRQIAFELGVAPGMERRLRAHRAVLVHAHFATDACDALPLVRRLGLPLVVTLHGYDVMRTHAAQVATRQGRRYLERQRTLFHYATAFLCVSEAIRRTAILRGFPPRKLQVLPIGLDLELYPMRHALPAEPLVLFIGRLVRKKGCDTLIAAMQEVEREVPGARLVIVGDGPERVRLETMARAQNVTAHFLGRQTGTQVRLLLAGARCLAAPSCTAQDGDGEGLPTVLMEALASGLPVASTVHSGIPELIEHGETGLLSPEQSVGMLARNMIQLCREDEVCTRIAAAGRARVEAAFDVGEQTRRLEQLYDEIHRQAAEPKLNHAPKARARGLPREPQPTSTGAQAQAGSIALAAEAECGDQETASLPAGSPQPRLRREAAWLLSGNGASMLLQALAFILIGRMLGAREYGAFVGAVALVNVLAQFSSLGMDIVLLRAVSRDRAQFAAAWFRALVITGTGALVLMGVICSYGELFLPPMVRPLLVFLVLGDGLFGRVTQMASRALQASGDARWCAKLLAATNVARCIAAAVLIAACALRHRTASLRLWAVCYAAASLGVMVLAAVAVTRRMGPPRRTPIRRAHLLEVLSFSLSNSAISVYNDIDKTVLMQHGMFYAAGIYGAAYRVVDVASAPIVSLFGAASPRLFRAGAAGGALGLNPEIRRLLRWAVPGGIAVAAALALGAPVLPRLFGPSFAGSVPVLRWLCLLPVLRGLHYAWGTAITACASQWLRTAAQATVALVNLLLNLWLIPRWGWQAAAAVSLLSDGGLALASWALFRALMAREERRAGEACSSACGPVVQARPQPQ